MGRYKNVQLEASTHKMLERLAAMHRRTIKGTVDWLAAEQLAREPKSRRAAA